MRDIQDQIRKEHERRLLQIADKAKKDKDLGFYAKEVNAETRRLRKTLIQIQEYFQEWKDVQS